MLASARPVKDWHLPGVAELDRLMASLQREALAVQVRGTLARPDTTPVPIVQIDKMLRALLWSRLR